MNSKQPRARALAYFRALILPCTILFSLSCDDEEPAAGYEVRFEANGTLTKFVADGLQTATITVDGDQYVGLFVGSDGSRTIALKVYDTEEITVDVYREFGPKENGYAGSLISYLDEAGTEYTQGAVVPDIRIRVTEMTSTYVKGTFAGTLKADGKPDLMVTHGEFFVRRLD